MNECEGRCEDDDQAGHRGIVRRVHVTGPNGFDWGEFNYCDTAVDIDRREEFIVTDLSAEAA